MKTNSIIIGIGAVGILCGGIFLGSVLNSGGDANGSDAANGDPAAGNAPKPSTLSSPNSAATKSSNSRESAWAKLTEKYGDNRTKLSKKVTEDISKIMVDAVELADMGAKLAGGKSAAEMASEQALGALSRQLNLTDEQKEKAAVIVSKRVSERFEAVKELTSAINQDPSAIMETILAGDALSRGEMTQDEYNGITGDTMGMLNNIAGFGMGGMGGGGASQLSDPLLAAELQSILDPAQQQQMAELAEQMQARAGEVNKGELPFQDGRLPVMDLEKLDATVQSTQKLTGGLRAMMDGFGELQNAMPPADGE